MIINIIIMKKETNMQYIISKRIFRIIEKINIKILKQKLKKKEELFDYYNIDNLKVIKFPAKDLLDIFNNKSLIEFMLFKSFPYFNLNSNYFNMYDPINPKAMDIKQNPNYNNYVKFFPKLESKIYAKYNIY